MLIFDHPLDVNSLFAQWQSDAASSNLGAFMSFCGIIRNERNEAGMQVGGLSFDINHHLLQTWLQKYKNLETSELKFYFAHASGDVMAGECSYFAAVAARKRDAAIKYIEEFVQDFKKSAPIWKYDLIDSKRVYAQERSFMLPHAGLLSL